MTTAITYSLQNDDGSRARILGIGKIFFSLSSLSKNLTISTTSTRLLRWLNHADHSRAQSYSLLRKTTISSPEPELPLSSGTGNGRSRKSWSRFNCAFCEVAYPFVKETFPREFSLARTLEHNRSTAVFLYVTFDRCIK